MLEFRGNGTSGPVNECSESIWIFHAVVRTSMLIFRDGLPANVGREVVGHTCPICTPFCELANLSECGLQTLQKADPSAGSILHTNGCVIAGGIAFFNVAK